MAVQLILPYGGGVEEKTNGILVKAENEPGRGIRPCDACSLAEKSVSLQLCRRNLAAYGNESGRRTFLLQDAFLLQARKTWLQPCVRASSSSSSRSMRGT